MRRVITYLTLAFLSGIAACPPPAVAQDRVLRIGLREDPDLLDPTLGSTFIGRDVYAAMCDKLFDIDAKLDVVPQLATGYEYADPTHLVIHLRPGVLFQDNEKMDADSVKTTLMRDLTAKGSKRAEEINAIQSIDVIDPLTVRLALKVPASQLLSQLTDRPGMIMSPKALAAEGDQFGLHPVCAGPFSFRNRVAQDRIVLDRFPAYWDAKNIHFDQVIYLPNPNSSVRLAGLQAGSLDLVEYIAPTDVATVRQDPKLTLAMDDGLAYMGLTFNMASPPGDNTLIGKNALVRRAFELAIDRKALIDVVYNGMYTPVAQANSPSSPFYVPSVQPLPRDVDAAKALLKQAGVTGPVPVTITVPNNPDLIQATEVIQAMTKEAGFDVHVNPMEFASSLQTAYNGNFQSYLVLFSGRVDADGNMYPFLHSGSNHGNYVLYSNPDVDKLLDDARLVTDTAQRRDIYAKVWDQQRRDMPLIYLWIYRNIVGMKKNLTGFVQVPDALIRVRGMAMTP